MNEGMVGATYHVVFIEIIWIKRNLLVLQKEIPEDKGKVLIKIV